MRAGRKIELASLRYYCRGWAPEPFARLNDIAYARAVNEIYDFLPGWTAIEQHFPRWLR